MRRNHVEMRSEDQTPPAQNIADLNERKPDASARFPNKLGLPNIKVLDEGRPTTRPSPESWVELENGQWLKVVRDPHFHLQNRVHRIELYDRRRGERKGTFRRQTEAWRR